VEVLLAAIFTLARQLRRATASTLPLQQFANGGGAAFVGAANFSITSNLQ